MYISHETPEETERRLLSVLSQTDFVVLEGTFAFEEVPVGSAPPLHPGALAYVRDDEVWSALVPSADPRRELFRLCRFHFPPGRDNSGFVGWIASHMKRALGTGVFVICGQNSGRGGIFDYLGAPATLGQKVVEEIARLRAGAA